MDSKIEMVFFFFKSKLLLPTFSTNINKSSFPAALPTYVLIRLIFNSPVNALSILRIKVKLIIRICNFGGFSIEFTQIIDGCRKDWLT